MYPYGKDLWIKTLHTEKFELKYYAEDELKVFNEVINQSSYDHIDEVLVNKFIKIIVDNELLLHLPEDIMIDNVFTRKFSPSNIETAKRIFLDLKELALADFENISKQHDQKQYTDLSMYSNIETSFFDTNALNAFTFFSNWTACNT